MKTLVGTAIIFFSTLVVAALMFGLGSGDGRGPSFVVEINPPEGSDQATNNGQAQAADDGSSAQALLQPLSGTSPTQVEGPPNDENFGPSPDQQQPNAAAKDVAPVEQASIDANRTQALPNVVGNGEGAPVEAGAPPAPQPSWLEGLNPGTSEEYDDDDTSANVSDEPPAANVKVGKSPVPVPLSAIPTPVDPSVSADPLAGLSAVDVDDDDDADPFGEPPPVPPSVKSNK